MSCRAAAECSAITAIAARLADVGDPAQGELLLQLLQSGSNDVVSRDPASLLAVDSLESESAFATEAFVEEEVPA